MLQIVFRVDASLDIGTGHVMRCLTVANMLRDKGVSCHFICRALSGNLIDFIRSQGYRAHALDPPIPGQAITDAVPHAAWLGVDWVTDARQSGDGVAALLSGAQADWLVVDHYALDLRWENTLRASCRRLLVIDDLADRMHCCDALIDQNIGRQPGDYKELVNPGCHLMTGTMHALLRPEFAALREASLARRAGSPLREMLVSLGGVDKDNATGVVLEGLTYCDLPSDLAITVVMGQQAPWIEQVKAQAARLPWKARTVMNVADMASLMASADIAIGAAGTTTWERCCLGLPSLILGTAENQRYVLSQLEERNVAVLGDLTRLRARPRELAPLFERLRDDQSGYARRAAALTEGEGCALLAQVLVER